MVLVVDAFKPHKAVMVQENVEIFERARNDPWEEGESPILKIKPAKKYIWGL